MPTDKEHSSKAEYNEAFFLETKGQYQDWAITGLFYSALHYVDALLSKKGHSVENHARRFWYVKSAKELKSLYPDYRALYDHSVNARYKMWKFTEAELDEIRKEYFLPIKKSVSKHLKKK